MPPREKVREIDLGAVSEFELEPELEADLEPIPVPRPIIDIVVMPLVDGYRYCLTMIDRFSRWPEAVPLKDMTAETISEALCSRWISRFGCPLTITTDQGVQFESALFKSLANMLGSEHIHTTPYQPQSNGMIERWHRSMKASLMCQPDTPWTKLLPTVMLGLRTCFKEDIKASAAEMLYGCTLRLPNEFFYDLDAPSNPLDFASQFRKRMQVGQQQPRDEMAAPATDSREVSSFSNYDDTRPDIVIKY
ncbi:uncharacterized protein LOC121405427 [Drosophila obscura]|uniref:uncharacterized protein LOC121405427 n=1 Tax=Drosophila obscura TaxID=7282 RepID=UPI001BB27BFD|nr:uncharacterized protein LOC121405427 [Drosophila obscura]